MYTASHSSYRWILLAITLIALIVRVYNINHGFGSHPDERFLMMRTLELADRNFNPEFFAYGSFPFYVLWGVSRVVGVFNSWYIGYDGLFTVGRSIAAVLGVACCLLLPLLANRLGLSKFVGVLAAFFLAVNPLHIQLSRFFTVDIFLTFTALLLVLACEMFARSPGFRRGALVAIFLGMSFAVKASSLALLVPVLVSVAIAVYTLNKSALWGLGVFVLIVIWSLVVTFVCAPFTFLDFSRFWQQTMEQVRMVAGEWRPPYTIQYAHTTPYLFHLKQMFFYTVRPSVSIFGVVGLLIALKRSGIIAFNRYTQPNFEMGSHHFQKGAAIGLLFCAALFLSTAGLQVKFPRYLLALYPWITLSAAYGIWRTFRYFAASPRRHLVGWLGLALIVSELARAIAGARVYNVPHTYEVASRWIYENVPAGAVLVGPHWDDGLPVSLPGTDKQYVREELPIYEADVPSKIHQTTAMLARADYLIFPTQRIPGSILRIPDEMPFSTTLLDQLYLGKLGFRLVYSLKIDPELFGFVWSSDLADESLSVYDRPKVWIFKNEAKFRQRELSTRVRDLAGAPLTLGLNAILKMHAGSSPSELLLSNNRGSVVTALQFLFVVLALSFLGSIFAITLFGIKAAMFGPTIGVFLFGLAMYLGKSVHVLGNGVATPFVVFGVLVAAAHVLVRKNWGGIKNFLRSSRAALSASMLCIVVLFSAIAVLRSFQPEVFWGEKPMDAGFLNYFMRSPLLPAMDPWASGNTMSYYYVGTFIVAEVLRLAQVSVPYAYNCGMILVSLLLITSVLGLLLFITRSRFVAVFGTLLVALGSNAEWIRLLSMGREINFDFFWATSRLFTSPQITEYPVWSLLFADLHAHVIALALIPLSFGFLYFMLTSTSALYTIGYGACLGLLLAVNTWDFLTLSFATAVIVALFEAANLSRENWFVTGRKGAWLEVISRSLFRCKQALIVAVTAFIVAAPFIAGSLAQRGKSEWGWVQREEFNFIGMWIRHLGIFALPFVIAALLLLLRSRPYKNSWLLYLPAAFTPLLTVLSFLKGVEGHPVGVLFLHTMVAVLACGLLAVRRTDESAQSLSPLRFGATLVYVAVSLSTIAELLYLLDRANTTFKVYNFIWILFGLGTVIVVSQAVAILRESRARFFILAPIAACAVMFLLSFTGSILNAYVMTTFKRIEPVVRPTLNGLAYLAGQNRDEALLWNWMQRNVAGLPTMVEAVGDSYQGFTRAVMHTGIPTVLGWQYHVMQRGMKHEEVIQRKEAVDQIYRTLSAEHAAALMQRYGATLIVVGEQEHRTYGASGLSKFDASEEFKKLFESGEVALYALNLSGDKILQVR